MGILGDGELRDYRASEVSELRFRADAAMKQFHMEWRRRGQSLRTQAEEVGPFEHDWIDAYKHEMADLLKLGHRNAKLAPKTRAAFEALMRALREPGARGDE